VTAAIRQWWVGLSFRERIAVLAAGALVCGLLLYVLALEPAWRTRQRLAAELPALREQAAELAALRLEASQLKNRTLSIESPQRARALLAKLLAEKAIAASAVREAEDGRLVVSVRRVDVTSWLGWLKEVSSELPLRISTARISRAGPGLVDAEVSFIAVGQKWP
jgi:general secretion pathway protein M